MKVHMYGASTNLSQAFYAITALIMVSDQTLPGLIDRWTLPLCPPSLALRRHCPEPSIMAVASFVITIDGEEVQRFSSYGQVAPRAPALPEPGSDADKFSFEYTGRHDDGDLLPPRSGGAHETALNAILVRFTVQDP
jgi:hypothetical protein